MIKLLKVKDTFKTYIWEVESLSLGGLAIQGNPQSEEESLNY